LILAAFPTAAFAAPFDPPTSALCDKSAPLVVNKAMLLKQLFAYEKIGDDLDQSPRDITYERRKDAILNPDTFCKTSQCAKGVPDKLGQASVDLATYFGTHTKPPSDRSKGYVHTSNVSDDPDLILKYFNGTRGAPTAACVLAAKPPGPPGTQPTPGPEATNNLPVRLAIRKNISDLVYSNDDAKFKGLDPADLSITDDMVTHTNSYLIDIALGAAIGPGVFANGVTGQVIPFLTYNQNYVQGNPKTSSRIANLGTGLTSDVLFPISGIYFDFQAYPKFVHSLSTGANIISGNLLLEPQPDWPLIGQVYYLVPGMLSAQLTPQFIYVFGNVLNDGGNVSLLRNGDFQRLGTKVAVNFYGEGALDGFSYTLSYEILEVLQSGPPSSLHLFQTSLNYTLSQLPAWSIKLQYVDGKDLDTLQDQKQITLGLGLKY
jgi:hypothetical protein